MNDEVFDSATENFLLTAPIDEVKKFGKSKNLTLNQRFRVKDFLLIRSRKAISERAHGDDFRTDEEVNNFTEEVKRFLSNASAAQISDYLRQSGMSARWYAHFCNIYANTVYPERIQQSINLVEKMKNETEFLTYLETASVEEITSDLKAVNNIKLPNKDAKSFNNFYPLISDYRRGGGSTTSPIKYIVELKNLLNIALSMNSKIIVPKLLQFPFEITPMGIYLIFNNNYKSYYPEIISRKLSTSLNIVETFYYDMYFQSLELDYPTLPTIPESYSFISLDKSIEYRTYKNMNIGEIILELANIHYLSENFKPHLDIDSYLTKLNILYDKGFAYAFNYNHRLMEADVTFVRRFLKILFVRQPNSVGIVKLTDDVQKLYDSFDLFSLFKEERRRTLQNNKKNYLPNNLVEALRNETTTAFKIGVNIIRFFYILYQKIGPSSVPVELVTIFKTFTKHDANIMVDVKNGITNYLLSCYQKTYNGWLTCYFLMRYADNENLITSDVHDNTDLTYLLTSL